jgi:hypothetical protein
MERDRALARSRRYAEGVAHLEEDPPSVPERVVETLLSFIWTAMFAAFVTVTLIVLFPSDAILSISSLNDRAATGMTPGRTVALIGVPLSSAMFALSLLRWVRGPARASAPAAPEPFSILPARPTARSARPTSRAPT